MATILKLPFLVVVWSALLLVVSGCSHLQAVEPARIDTSSDENLRASVAKIDAQLTPAQREKFIEAVVILDLANPRFKGLKIEQIMSMIHGMTAQEIIDFAAAHQEPVE